MFFYFLGCNLKIVFVGDTDLNVSLAPIAGSFIRVIADIEVEERKRPIFSHEQTKGVVEIGLIPLPRHCPTSQL